MTEQPSGAITSPSTKPKKPWYLRWWVWVLAVFIGIPVLAGVVSGIAGGGSEPVSSTSTPTATEEAAPSQEPTPTEPSEAPAPEETTETPTDSLATRTEAALLNAWGVSSFIELAGQPGVESAVYAITEFEDGGSYVRVYVQENLTDTERDDMARMIRGLTQADVPDLGTIVIRDASGIDSNHFK